MPHYIIFSSSESSQIGRPGGRLERAGRMYDLPPKMPIPTVLENDPAHYVPFQDQGKGFGQTGTAAIKVTKAPATFAEMPG